MDNQGILPSKKVQDKADNCADDDAGGDRKVKTKAISLDVNIAWQIPEPRDSSSEGK